jgi:hypothetical protein
MTRVALYVGFAAIAVAIWQGLRVPQVQPATPVPINFVNTAGLKLARVGLVFEIVGLVFTEIALRLFSNALYAVLLSVETVGLLTVMLGMVVGLTIEFGLIRREMIVVSRWKRWLTLFFVVLMFASIWLGATGVFLSMAMLFRSLLADVVMATLLALIASLVLVPAKRVLPGLGSALAVGVVFIAVSCFFVEIARASLYVPWGLVAVAVFDLLILGLKRLVNARQAGFAASTVLGLLFWATYYPFSSSLFPWSSTQPLLLAVVLGSIAGAMLGDAVFAALTSAVLENVLG